jgi:hypothetical protein
MNGNIRTLFAGMARSYNKRSSTHKGDEQCRIQGWKNTEDLNHDRI